MESNMNMDEKKLLLALARETLENALGEEGSRQYELANESLSPTLHAKKGAFVTLRKKSPYDGGRLALRGCIGYLTGIKPLWNLVRDLAMEAAFQDPRFPPLQIDELHRLVIEISVLTTPRTIETPEEFVPGRDGIILSLGYNRAVFLPQVATEQGWGREEMLDNLCLKAGLDPSAWRDPDCRFETFRATVFSEEEQ
jgi:AmmeMemoRadiSam system protein A